MKSLLSMKGITKRYPGVVALNHVDLELDKGEVLALVGENGAGKSTLIKTLCGVIRKDEGTISIDGEEVHISNPLDAQKAGIRAVQQHFSLIPTMSVAENLFFSELPINKARILDRKRMNREAKELLDSLGFGDLDPTKLVSDISVANAQRVEVAKAIRFTPKILILDEPSAVLPENDVKTLFQIIRKLKKSGVGIIYISHHMDEVFEIADTIAVLKDGENVVNIDDVHSVNQFDLVQYMVGREIKNIYPPIHTEIGETVLHVEGLSTNFVKDVSFELHQGEILGFAGLVGSGRTEICRALFGLDKITSGKITLRGNPYAPKKPKDAIDAGFGFVTEDRHYDGLILDDSVERNIGYVGLDKLTRLGVISGKKSRQVAQSFVESLRIATPHVEQEVVNLSGGNQQKVVLAKWLFIEPKIILFDEGTRGIDVNAKHEIYELLHKLVENGHSIIMVSSELPEVMQMSNRILVMYEGKLVSEFGHDEATEEAIMEKASGI